MTAEQQHDKEISSFSTFLSKYFPMRFERYLQERSERERKPGRLMANQVLRSLENRKS